MIAQLILKGAGKIIPPQQILPEVFRYGTLPVYTVDEPEAFGPMGNPVFMPFKFEATTYQKQVNGTIQNFSTEDLFLACVIVECSRTKIQESTPVEGRDGTTKEFAALDDYRVTIKGILGGTQNGYPTDEVKMLRDIESAPVSIDIACEYFQQFNIFQLMVKRIRWVAMPGVENCQAFELDCFSDDDLLYQLNNNM